MVTNCYPKCTRTHDFDIKIQKFLWGGGTGPTSTLTPSAPRPVPPSHQILATPLVIATRSAVRSRSALCSGHFPTPAYRSAPLTRLISPLHSGSAPMMLCMCPCKLQFQRYCSCQVLCSYPMAYLGKGQPAIAFHLHGAEN